MNPLGNKAMLVRLSVHCWFGKKIDRKAAAAAASSLQISGGSDEYYKYLVPKAAFAPIQDTVARLRAFHHWATFPWFDNGLRVLPGKMFFTYRNKIDEFKTEFANNVETFIGEYEAHKQFAAANRAALYDPHDYPSIDELRETFRIETNVMPVPESDFRLDLDPDTLEQLKQQMINDQKEVLARNVQELSAQLFVRLTQMQKMCSAEPPKIYEATITRLIDCAEMAQNLNITNDPRLVAIVSSTLSNLNIDPNALRLDPQARERTAKACKDILELYL